MVLFLRTYKHLAYLLRGWIMRCQKCGESDRELFYLNKCRRCKTISLKEQSTEFPITRDINFDIKLTNAQKKISEELVESVKYGDVFIDAVCGAGKTEICLELVKQTMIQGRKVGWAVPRREVVLELKDRLANYFKCSKVVAVCQGYTSDIFGNLIVCTTHQLYRYENYFDILILDEPDAFPYANNKYLESLMRSSCKGSIVYLSATFEIEGVKTLSLPIRPSYKLLPVPVDIRTRFPFVNLLILILKHKSEHCLIFVPTIKVAKFLSKILRIPCISSQSPNKQEMISKFKEDRSMLITTTVLERGVTFIDCYVFVFKAEHRVFTEGSLVQIAGRAMRGMNPQKGGVWFISSESSDAIEKCINRILKANQDAQFVLNPK